MIDPSAARRATEAVPDIPCDAEGPVFREPWEAQAFAMALALREGGLFNLERMGTDTRRRNRARANRGRSRHRRNLLPARVQCASSALWPARASQRATRCSATRRPGTAPP